jgi:hypothetical protein
MNCRGCGRKLSWPDLKYYSDIWLEGLGKAANPDNRITILGTEIKPHVLENGKQREALNHSVR